MSAIDDTCLRQYPVKPIPTYPLTLAPPFTILSLLPALEVPVLDALEDSLAVAAVFADVGQGLFLQFLYLSGLAVVRVVRVAMMERRRMKVTRSFMVVVDGLEVDDVW